MKLQKKWLIVRVLCMALLMRNESGLVIPQRIKRASITDTVNTDGIVTEQGKDNMLPRRYYGNLPGTGVVEVGGKAGNIFRENTLPSLNVKLPCDFWMVFIFKDDLREMKSEKECTFGFYTETKSNGVPEKIDFRMRGKALTDLFDYDTSTKKYLPKYSENRTMAYRNFFLYPDDDGSYHKFAIVFKNNVRFDSFHLYYDDEEHEIENVVLNSLPERDMFISKDNVYQGSDKDYEEKILVEKTKSLSLKVNYGDYVPKDYIIENLPKLYGKMKTIQKYEIDDADSYFEKGKNPSLNSTYRLNAKLYYSSSDSVSINLTLTIADEKEPEIIPLYQLPTKVKASYDTLKDDRNFVLNHFFVQDNYDPNPKIELVNWKKEKIEGNQIFYGACYVKATDSNQNTTFYIFNLESYDAVGPKISQSVKEVTTTMNRKIPEETLLSYFYAEDDIDGIVPVKIYRDDYSENYNRMGDYKFVVKAVDTKENTSIASLIVHVKDNEAPAWEGNSTSFTFTYGNIPPIEEIIESLKRQSILEDKEYTDWEQLSGETYNETLPIGLHEIEIRFYSEEEYKDIYLSIKVIENENTEVIEEEELSFWERFCKWWADLWAKIVAFFTGKS